jgi:N-acetylglutamate synthase-like GNAT family acetyltransferase
MTEARAFLQQRGFKEGDERVSMIGPLRANSWDTPDAEQRFETEGVAFRRAGRSDLQPTLDFIRTGFPYWTAEAATCFLRRPISLHLAEELGIVIGFAAYDANNPGLAWFGPTGVQPDKRRRGIGEVLLKRCLRDLRDQGHEEAVIPWVGPVSFYEKACQATIYRRFLPVQKAL